MEREEKKRSTIAFAASTAVHLALLLFFLFSMAWRAPDPPLPEFGIELNFGDSPQGSGDVQPETPTAAEEQPQVPNEPVKEEVKPEVVEATEQVVPSNQESIVPEPKKEKPVKPAPVEKPRVEEKKVDQQAVYKPTETKGEQPESEGDDKDKTGDKGDPKGVPDPNAAYSGKPGGGAGGDGMTLSMAGWAWAEQPQVPGLPDNENGRVVFEIECDETGEIIGIKTLERGLSAKAEQLLIEEIRKNSLVRTSGGETPTHSKGRVVFILKTK